MVHLSLKYTLMIQIQSCTAIGSHRKHHFPPLSISSILCLPQIMQDGIDQRESLTHEGLIQAVYNSSAHLSPRTWVWPTDNVPKCFPFIWIFVSQYNIGSTFIYSLQETCCSVRLGHFLAPRDLARHCLDLWVETFPISLPPLHNRNLMHTHLLASCAKFLLYVHNFRSIGCLGKGPNMKS